VVEGQTTIHFDGDTFGMAVADGASRGDTRSVCSETNTGFGSLSSGICSGIAGAQLQPKIEQLNPVLEEYADELTRGEVVVVTPAGLALPVGLVARMRFAVFV
jgi:hypothetical protein